MKITPGILRILKSALDEDIGTKDVTTGILFPDNPFVEARLISKDSCVLAGIDVFKETFRLLDRRVSFSDFLTDGALLAKGQTAGRIYGPIKAILTGERVSLNILSRLSGIATLTSRFVRKAHGRFEILDTRKTTPGLRALEKYAVRVAGGKNHRMRMDEMILIKDNHINAFARLNKISRVDSIAALVSRAKRKARNLKVEVEVESYSEAMAATKSGADILMFDNTSALHVKKFLNTVCGRRPVIEVSGGITLENISTFYNIPVDYVSIGALTHSAPAIDFSLEIE